MKGVGLETGRRGSFIGGILLCLILSACSAQHVPSGAKSSSFKATEFSIKRNIQILPFPTRISKLKTIVGTNPDLYMELERNRYELGDFDYASGTGQDLTWTNSRMNLWIRSLQPLCSSGDVQSRFPFSEKSKEFVKAVYGREPNRVDLEVINRISALTVSANEKTQVLCTVLLSSLEFVHL